MHHRFAKVHLGNRKQITGRKLQTFPRLSISGKLEAENLFSFKTVYDLDLHFSDIISYANR